MSQIVRTAVGEIAHREVIDLTLDDSDNDIPRQEAVNKPVSQTPVLASTVTPVTPMSKPIKTLDLNAVRKLRKPHRTPQQLRLSKPTLTPFPRNLHRVSSAPTLPEAITMALSSTQVNAMASSSTNDRRSLSKTPYSSMVVPPPLPRPILPRLCDLRKSAQDTSIPYSQATPGSPPSIVALDAGSPQIPPSSTSKNTSSEDVRALGFSRRSPAVDLVPREATPPRSSSPEDMEEEGCLSLVYPDSAENSPEVETDGHGPDTAEGHALNHELHLEREREQDVIIPNGRRTRSQATSEASSIMSGPRRSTRLTSGSASSSVEPPEQPITRSRRSQPYIRTPSDDVAVSQGGISRDAADAFTKAFEDAGFESLSWSTDRKRIAAEFTPLVPLARNIPHELHDRLNSLSLGARYAGNMQLLIFEAEIRANTARDEPRAPPILIVNEVDNELTPPLEFYYSNLMWHGEGVPEPDHENLHGCDCVGPCDPLSRTCACVKRQRECKWDRGGFVYDKKGKLRATEYPIVECNMHCACSEDCMNRVVQNGRQHEIAICKTPNKGWGVFAGPRKIAANSYLGLYAGEYLTHSESEARGRLYNKFGRTYLFDLDFWHLNNGTGEVKYCVDAYHAGNFTRYLNHSCDPNCIIVACYINEANLDKPLLTIFTCRDVEPYEELCFSYLGQLDDDDEDDEEDNEEKDEKDDAVYVKCQCGAPNCRGKMWK